MPKRELTCRIRPEEVINKPVNSVSDSLRRRGFFYCLGSSLCYTLTFFLVRCLAGRINPDWILCVRESVGVLVALPVILILMIRRKFPWPPVKMTAALLVAGFFCEFLGARMRIWSYAVLGLVLANPLIQISTILETLLLGTVFLREKVSWKKCAVFVILTAAILTIALSRSRMEPLLKDSFLTSHIGWGIGLALLTGLGHTLFYVIMRKISKKERPSDPPAVPLVLSMFLICLVGAVTGGGFFLAKEGAAAFWTVPGSCWGLAFAAGVSVSVAFLLLNLGLRYASASKVTMIAVSQLVLLTLLGRFVLHEPMDSLVWLGLTLACIGILLTIDLD